MLNNNIRGRDTDRQTYNWVQIYRNFNIFVTGIVREAVTSTGYGLSVVSEATEAILQVIK